MAKRLAPYLAAMMLVSALPATAPAAMELYFSDATGDAHQVQILPGESFTIEVGLATTEACNGLSYWLNISELGSGKFTITNREFPTNGAFLDLITSNAQALTAEAGLLDPRNDRDLGALNDDPNVGEPPGLYVVATLTITAASDVAPGTYTLNGWNCIGTNPAFESIPLTVHDYIIVVTDGSGGGDTDTDPTNTDGGTTDTTDGGTTDTGDQTTDNTDTGTDTGTSDTQTDTTDNEAAPTATASRCGVGFGGFTGLLALGVLRFARIGRSRRA